MHRLRHARCAAALSAVLFFTAAAFLLLSFRTESFDMGALLLGAIVSGVILLSYCLLSWLAPHADKLLILTVFFLCALGMVVQYRIEPETAARQLMMLGIGLAAMLLMMALMRRPRIFRVLSIPMALLSLGILGALIFVGKESGGAKNWISVGGILFQPSEFVKVALVFVLADALTERTHVRDLVPLFLFVGAVAAFLVLQRDLGAAMLMAGTFLLVFFVATSNIRATLAALLTGSAGAYASYLMFDHVRARIAIWQDPWATYSTSGYQIAQGLMAIASGGLWGLGLGQGSPKMIPAYHTDYIFAVICEEFGIVFGVGVIALYLLIVVRGVLIALHAEDRFSMLAAFGATAMLAVQTFVIIGGVIKLIPLTGITMPFVSYGGSSMIACMLLAGILEGVVAKSSASLEDALARDTQPSNDKEDGADYEADEEERA
ncbi:MAG: FtsW/RodA/SpoVE family cell cycle protein [Christensenellaceae bacterium]|nr:FtsW/RodA/SpoVE family cell cycle protein [Christensenellaceae bacterium]